MTYHIARWSEAKPVEMVPGLFRRTLGETDKMMVVEVRAEQGVAIPEHSHPHDQAGYVVSGEIALTIAGDEHHFKPGDSYGIPGDVPHSATFPVESIVIDIFSPPREEYR